MMTNRERDIYPRFSTDMRNKFSLLFVLLLSLWLPLDDPSRIMSNEHRLPLYLALPLHIGVTERD
jgi:hypothetical protein